MSLWAGIWLTLLALLLFSGVAAMAGAVANKAGFSRWYGVLMVVPVVNLVVLYLFAFIKWPAAVESGGKG